MLKIFTLIFFTLSFFYPAIAQDTPVIKKKDPAAKLKVRPTLIRGPYLQVATISSMVSKIIYNIQVISIEFLAPAKYDMQEMHFYLILQRN